MPPVRRRYPELGFLLAAVLVVAPGSVAGAQVLEATLDNGLRVLLLEDHRSPVVALQLWYRVGSRNERIGLTGLSHFLEHMMFKGTPRYGPRMYAALVDAQGGQQNAYTSRDATVYYVNVVADKIDLVLDLEADRMRHLSLDPQAIEAERKVVVEERRTRTEDDPIGALSETFHAMAFMAHPYRLPIIGFMQDIERLTAVDLRGWYDAYYVPNNAVLVAAGALKAPELLEKVRARFGAIPRGREVAPVVVVEPEQRGERRVWIRKEAQLPVVFVGYPAPNFRSADAYPLEVLSVILSAGRASRLYRRLVYEERVALGAGGEYDRLTLDPDTFTFYATVLPEKTVEEAERVLMAEVERIRTELVTEEELQRAKNQIEATFLFEQDSISAQASTLGRYELLGNWRLRDQFLPGIRAVTRDDVLRVAQRYFARDRQTTAILVPVASGSSGAIR
jgi:zinc protease